MTVEAAANYERNRRTLGKAVHPAALARLHELWPEARVKVSYHHAWLSPADQRKFGGVSRKLTVVCIERGVTVNGVLPPRVYGTATKHPHDRDDRRYGIELAFRRALWAVPR